MENEAFVMLRILSGVHDAIEAKVSPGGGDVSSAQGVVDNLTSRSVEHVDGIGPRVVIVGQSENKILVAN